MPTAARLVLLGLLAALFASFGAEAVLGQDRQPRSRLALVIAEASYPQARLPTAAADAGLVATALAQAGFDVTAVCDADAATLRRTIAGFVAEARGATGATLAIYVAGDGLQYGGENWLVPVGARIDTGDDVPGAALKLTELTAPLEAVPAATRVFLFDLARETPFARKGPPLASGLALVDASAGNVYAFNTAPGAVMPPSVPPYGAYARALAEAMQQPGVSIGEMLRRVRLRVAERTNGAAVPFDDGASDAAFAFVPATAAATVSNSLPDTASGSAVPLPTSGGAAEAYSSAVARDTLPAYANFIAAFPHDPLTPRARAMAAARREALFWSEAVRANTPRAYWTYLRRYPRGPHFADIRRKLHDLHAALEPPPRFDIVPFEGLPPPSIDEVSAVQHPFVTFADADGTPIPTPSPTLVPPTRSAFFETLPPPPVAPAGALPLPLPVAVAAAGEIVGGRIVEPEVRGGALVTTFAATREGLQLSTEKKGGAILFRIGAAVTGNVRTVTERASDGAVITRTTIGTGADGALTVAEVGPNDAPLSRALTRDLTGGARVTTVFDDAGLPVATTVVSAGEIVTAQGLVPGRAPPRRFILGVRPDGKGPPVVFAEPEAVLQPELAPSSSEMEAGASRPAFVGQDATKPPAMPAAAGLTGQAPALNLPPAPPTPAFDAAAAPVSSPPDAATSVAAPPSAALPVPGPAAPATALKAAVAPAPASTGTADKPPAGFDKPSTGSNTPAAAKELEAAHLPSTPPLPPARAVKGKRRDAR